MRDSALDVLVVEDDFSICEVLQHHLVAEGFLVRTTPRGDDALDLCQERMPDVVVLDLSLPGLSGLSVCARLRAVYNPSPGVVMVTARASEVDVMRGFEAGADDYVIKPCRPREVVARVRALGRRVRPIVAPSRCAQEVLVRGALRIDVPAMRAAVGGRALELTGTELALLVELARAPGRVHTRAALLQRVWGSTHVAYGRNVDCHIARLRRKLAAAGLSPGPIATVHGAGYRFVEGEER